MKVLLCIALLLQGCLFSSGEEPRQLTDGPDDGSTLGGPDGSTLDDAGGSTTDASIPAPDVSGPDVPNPPDLGAPPDMAAPCMDGRFDCSNQGGFECKNGVWEPMSCPDDQICDEMMGCACRETCVPGNDDTCDPRPSMRGAVIDRCEISPSGCPTHVTEPCDGICSQPNGQGLECIEHECSPADNECLAETVLELCDRDSPAEQFKLITRTCPTSSVCDPNALAAGDQPCVACANDCNQVGEVSCMGLNNWVECKQTSQYCRENVTISAPCTPPPIDSNDTWQFVACGPQADEIQRCYKDNNGCGDLRTEQCESGTTCVASAFNCQ